MEKNYFAIRTNLSKEEIRKLRHYLSLSIEEFARILGVSSNTVFRWEKKGIIPNPSSGKKLAVLMKNKKRFKNMLTKYDGLAQVSMSITRELV